MRSWGEGEYPRAHGVHMAPDGLAYCGAAFNRRQALQTGLVESIEDLTKDIELKLVRGVAADADWPRAFVPR
jgi:hypothetical protein